MRWWCDYHFHILNKRQLVAFERCHQLPRFLHPLSAFYLSSFRQYLFLDLGLMQTMLGTPAANVLLASDVDFVNKGAASEMFAGLELVKNHDCF